MPSSLTHKIRLYPTVEQETAFRKACGVRRYAYNWGLAKWKELKAAGVQKVTKNDLKKLWNAEKESIAKWVYESPKDANQHAFDDLYDALSAFFKNKGGRRKVGFPKFKKKGKSKDSFYVSNDRMTLLDKKDGKALRVRLPVIGDVKIAEALRFEGKILSSTVSRTANHWFLSVSVEMPSLPKGPLQTVKPHAVVGIDLGVKTLATLSTGEKVEGPKPLRKSLEALKRASRQLSRKQKGSSNSRKAAMRVAGLHEKVASIRMDALHKLSHKVCSESQAVVLEDLSVSGMMKFGHLARSVSDMGFFELRRQCGYKGELYGCENIVVDRFYPSSKKCNACGSVKKVLLLSERKYVCECCGVVEDRDYNASLNLRDFGYSTLGYRGINAHGEVSSGFAERQSETDLVEVGSGTLLTCEHKP